MIYRSKGALENNTLIIKIKAITCQI